MIAELIVAADPDAVTAVFAAAGAIPAPLGATLRKHGETETIKKFRLLEEFSIENGMLTPTLKVKRNVAMDRFADVIDEMYVES